MVMRVFGKLAKTVGAPLATLVVERITSYVAENWENWAASLLKEVGAWWNGKNIAVLGATASGKDSFISCLQKEEPHKGHVNTTGVEKVESFRIDYPFPDGENICFNVKEGINVGGEDEDKERYWSKVLEGADLIFYLIDFPKFFKELQALDLEEMAQDGIKLKLALKEQQGEGWRILEDMRFLASQISYFPEGKRPLVSVLLNKYDQLEGFPARYIAHATPEDREEILENIAPSLNLFLSLMQPLMKKELGTFRKQLKTIEPMSCGSLDLFKFFFPNILRKVAGK
ncbi:hypothetical protein FAI41_04055 [Acetobacteraceae bacterium]|nr:hypothetical protein FAI41_04055 [Acetobacteraceae bacterium]